jgi:uncharacterized damage-inducible protein DinB
VRTIQDFLRHYRRQRDWTRTIVAAVPQEHFEWSPASTAFSCGDLVRHLMQSEVFWSRLLVKAAGGENWEPFGLEGSPEERMQRFREPNLSSSHDAKYGATFDECLDRWSEIQARTEAELSKIPDEALYEVDVQHPVTTLEAPLWQMILVMLEHEAHHRGQLTAYLKMLGVEQPAAVIAT